MIQAILLVDRRQPVEVIKLLNQTGKKSSLFAPRQYLEKGKEALVIKPRGINKLLTRKQLEEIVKTVKTKKPKDLGFYVGYEFWNTGVLS